MVKIPVCRGCGKLAVAKTIIKGIGVHQDGRHEELRETAYFCPEGDNLIEPKWVLVKVVEDLSDIVG